MAPSFDCAVSSLLCAEESTFFDDCDFGGLVEQFEASRVHRIHDQNLIFDGLPLMVYEHECVALMMEKESQHSPNGNYLDRLRNGDLDFEARKEAIGWIEKVRDHFGFGPLCAYLSINYLDRFLSAYELPKGKAWTMQLLAVACLSLAAKLEETKVPLSVDLQVGESKFVFEARTIQRMELLVLSTLGWRMQSITPFSFTDYFFYKIYNDQIPHRTSIQRSIQVILSTVKGIDFLEFKPSELAAAVAISVAKETQTVVDTDKTISILTQQIVKKERVLKCIKLMENLSIISGCLKDTTASVPSVPQSPIGVLDAGASLSYKSDDTTRAVSCANSSSHNSPDAKRRKLNKL